MNNATFLLSEQAYVETPHCNVSNRHTIAGSNGIVPIESKCRNIIIASEDISHWIDGAFRKEVMTHSRGPICFADAEAASLGKVVRQSTSHQRSRYTRNFINPYNLTAAGWMLPQQYTMSTYDEGNRETTGSP